MNDVTVRPCSDEEFGKEMMCHFCKRFDILRIDERKMRSDGRCVTAGLIRRVRFVSGDSFCNQFQHSEDV
jgi:hypothetical protein